MRVLVGDGSYLSVGLRVLVDGDDLLVKNVRATWFGGGNDPDDSGLTASGVATRGRPNLMGCSLPMDLGPGAKQNPCHGSPIPRIPWFTRVRVYSYVNQRVLTVPLIDIGPSRPPIAHAPIDLTQAAYRALAGSLEKDLRVDFRIIGGSKYLHG
jgi:hypothetical protein